MKDLHEGILLEFAERQALATPEMSYERAGLTYKRRSSLVYFADRRADRKQRGVCCCGEPAAINEGSKNRGKRGTRCAECAASRRKAA